MIKSRLRLPWSYDLIPGQQGMTLIEVLIALLIIGIVAVTYLAGMSTSSKAVIASQEQVIGESLGKSQLEYVKRQPYDAISPVEYAIVDVDPDLAAAGYAVQVTAHLMNPRGDTTANDDGLQRIVVTITRDGETVFTLEGYKCFTAQ